MCNQNPFSAPSLEVRNAHLAFRDVILFDNLNFTLPGGKWTCLLGPSGIGKTTLLQLIANLIVPQNTTYKHTRVTAEIRVDNKILLSKQIAYMAQTDLLLPWLSVLDNVLIGSRLRGISLKSNFEKAKDLLSRVGLENAIKLFPRHLSGGMRQRVALARTLIEDKPIVLMDEPFSSLDAITRFNLQTVASDLLKNKTVLLITHDPLEALRVADEIYIMSGQPATLHSPLKLSGATPRDPADPIVMKWQAILFHELTKIQSVNK
jgi:putative hydroxymethylpyrimidine transport system ATP-binding protein